MADRYCIQVHLGNICEKQKESKCEKHSYKNRKLFEKQY